MTVNQAPDGQQIEPQQQPAKNPPPAWPPRQQEPSQQDEQHEQNYRGTVSFILGLLATIPALAPGPQFILTFGMGVVGLSLGIVQRRRISRGEARNRSITHAGIVLNAIGMVLSIGMPVLYQYLIWGGRSLEL